MDRNDKGQGVTGHRIDLYWSPRRNIRGRQFCHVIGLFGISAECVPYIVANFFLLENIGLALRTRHRIQGFLAYYEGVNIYLQLNDLNNTSSEVLPDNSCSLCNKLIKFN